MVYRPREVPKAALLTFGVLIYLLCTQLTILSDLSISPLLICFLYNSLLYMIMTIKLKELAFIYGSSVACLHYMPWIHGWDSKVSQSGSSCCYFNVGPTRFAWVTQGVQQGWHFIRNVCCYLSIKNWLLSSDQVSIEHVLNEKKWSWSI